MERRTTIKDIAQKAAVSIATVSRVLNQNAFVTDEVKQRVMAAAHELDYIPNTAAQSLKTNKTSTIGFVISDISSEALILAARATESVIAREKYNMILCSTENDPIRERDYLKMLVSKNVDGIILNTTGKNTEAILEVNRHIPIVLYNRRIDDPRFVGDLVDTNNFQASYQLTRQVLLLGHRRILVVRGPDYLSNAEERFEGFAKAMQEAGVDVTSGYPYIFTGEFCYQTGADAVDFLLTMEEPPTAIISHNVTMSLGIMARASAKNIKIPEDISFVSYDGISNVELMTVRPTSAMYDTAQMGTQIGRSMLERIENPQMESRKFIFDPQIVQGNSLGVPSGAFLQKPQRN